MLRCATQVVTASVKSMDSIERKRLDFCQGDVRRITDMARISVVCGQPAALAAVVQHLKDIFQVEW